jgi:hypothetical protein
MTVRSEIVTIYGPRGRIEIATAHAEIATNDQLVRLIREAKLNLWFARVVGNHQARWSLWKG